jgi:DNA-binding LytR/AlgR family response regulator
MLKVAIIQDQRKFERNLARICAAMGPNWTIAGEAGGVQEGIALIYDTRPDLVILHPHLPDGSGFAIFEATTELEYRKALIAENSRLTFKAARYNALVFPHYLPEDQLAASLASLHGCQETLSVQQMYEVQRSPYPRWRIDFCIAPDGNGHTGFWTKNLLAVVNEGPHRRIWLSSGESYCCGKGMSAFYAALQGHPIATDFQNQIIYLPQVQDIDTETQGAYIRFRSGLALAIERVFLPVLRTALDHYRKA